MARANKTTLFKYFLFFFYNLQLCYLYTQKRLRIPTPCVNECRHWTQEKASEMKEKNYSNQNGINKRC